METVGDKRIAGLGGVFREDVWHPAVSPRPVLRSRRELVQNICPGGKLAKWKASWEQQPGVPLKHRVSVWPEDYDRLSNSGANILVTHEAPSSCSKRGSSMGFGEIDLLAEALGVKAIFHGHHHVDYDDVLPSGIKVFGVGRAGVRADDGRILFRGKKRSI